MQREREGARGGEEWRHAQLRSACVRGSERRARKGE